VIVHAHDDLAAGWTFDDLYAELFRAVNDKIWDLGQFDFDCEWAELPGVKREDVNIELVATS
jgi:hypothetical protein